MSQFSLELTRTLRAALDDAAIRLQSDSSTKAFMAEQILKAAADGVRRREELTDIAVKAAARQGHEARWLSVANKSAGNAPAD